MLVMSNATRIGFALLVATLMDGTGAAEPAQQLMYPAARRADVVDEYFGVKVSDPYRWMEEADSKEVAKWVAAQNKLTFRYLEHLPLREHFRRRITELWNYSKTNVPRIESGRLFYRRNSGLQRQFPIYMRTSPAAAPRLIIDPNALSPDGSVSLADFAPSPNARYLAYTLADGGADWQTVHVRDIATGRDLRDAVRWMRFSWLSWTKDSRGFFYSRYPEPPKGRVLEAQLAAHALYYHRLGTPQSADRLIYERKDLPTAFIDGWATESGRYLIVNVRKGAGPKNRLYYADLENPQRPRLDAPVKPIVEDEDFQHAAIGNSDTFLYVRTDRDAPKQKVVAVDLRDPRREAWQTLVPESNDAIRKADLIGGRIVIEYLTDVRSRLALFDQTGRPQGEIELPEAGNVTEIRGREDGSTIFYSFTSALYPATVFAYDPRTRKSTPFDPPPRVADAGRYESKQYFATSKDGTRVPFTVTARKDLPRDGNNPALLLGYGGFSISQMPFYRPHVIAWLELGGIWVSSNIRGGGEYGEAWYKAARAEKRQNGFDDFIAVAEELVREKFTSPARLAILGGSNGGLLVATVSQQRPDLYAVAMPAVAVTDMLRFDKFTGGHAWILEYGSPGDPAQFTQLYKYSPLHNVKPGTCYPATFVTTADHDDRVVPSHSFKYDAAMQAGQGCPRPVLVRVEPKASHGYRPTDRLIAEIADQWTFAAEHAGMHKR
jgi:prolyl oligopeptidase